MVENIETDHHFIYRWKLAVADTLTEVVHLTRMRPSADLVIPWIDRFTRKTLKIMSAIFIFSDFYITAEILHTVSVIKHF